MRLTDVLRVEISTACAVHHAEPERLLLVGVCSLGQMHCLR